jgi:hypothetical protein
MYSVAAVSDEATNISLESLKSASQQNMYHNTAWFGKRLNYTFFRPTADSKWQAINGNEIEYWSTGYYDLLARNGSSGIAITVENVPAGKYTLKWKHMQRPDGGSTGYSVRVSGAATASKSFTAPKSNSEGEIHEAFLTFEVSECGTLVLSFDAGSSGTSGPLVGSIALCEAFGVIKVDWNADAGGKEFAVTQDSGAAFTGSDWDVSRTRQANPVAFQSGSNLKLIPTFNAPTSSPPTAIRAQVTLGNSTKTYTLPWAECGEGFSIPAPVPAGTVGYFENVQVTWSVSHDSEAWEDAGTSTHEIYFTRGTPQAGLAQETLFWVACSACHGKSADEDIIDGIWSKFSSGSGPTNLCRRDGTPMKYWGEKALINASTSLYFSASELLADADGKCGAWAQLLTSSMQVQKIKSVDTSIEPINKNEGFLIKNYTPKNIPTSSLAYPYAFFWSMEEYSAYPGNHPALIDETGVPGQNISNPTSTFADHALVRVSFPEGEKYYDPSYGTGPFSSIEEWEDYAVAGYATRNTQNWITVEGVKRPACREKERGKKACKEVVK